MIHSIEVENFRCYKHLTLSDFARVNLIVGDNGSGKTALLESIFMPLGNSPELGMRLRQHRGLEAASSGTVLGLEDAFWGDFFYDYNTHTKIKIKINADGGANRMLQIVRGGAGATMVPVSAKAGESPVIISPLVFTWTDAFATSRSVTPQMTNQGMVVPSTGEYVEDFYFFPSTQNIQPAETAMRFSVLSRKGQEAGFVKAFTKEFPWIEGLSLEVVGGSSMLFGKVKGKTYKLPLPDISSGINRVLSIVLAMASSPGSIFLIDEVENGIYYEHLQSLWRLILSFSAQFRCQVLVSSHSLECIRALDKVAGSDINEVALYRTHRDAGVHEIERFAGKDLHLALKYNQEVR